MFTGLIEEVGTIESSKTTGEGLLLTIGCQTVLQDAKIGDSIAIDGVCLTVTKLLPQAFEADAIPETVQRTHLSSLKPGTKINLERAMALGERMGGHLVQGHVDGTATLIGRSQLDNATLFRFQADPALTHYMVEKGSVTINGISLTLIEASKRTFAVSIIPHTLEATNMGQLKVGDLVNIECDLIGKYIAKLLNKNDPLSIDDFISQR